MVVFSAYKHDAGVRSWPVYQRHMPVFMQLTTLLVRYLRYTYTTGYTGNHCTSYIAKILNSFLVKKSSGIKSGSPGGAAWQGLAQFLSSARNKLVTNILSRAPVPAADATAIYTSTLTFRLFLPITFFPAVIYLPCKVSGGGRTYV